MSVFFSKNNLAAHKRSACKITKEEKDFWIKMKYRLKVEHEEVNHDGNNQTSIEKSSEISEQNSNDVSGKIICEYCHKTFSSIRNWRNHENVHTNPFICDICQKHFGTKFHLENHIFTHIRANNNEKPDNIYCNICRRHINRGTDMKTHKMEFHNLHFPAESELGRLMARFQTEKVEPEPMLENDEKEQWQYDGLNQMSDDDMITQIFIKEEKFDFEEEIGEEMVSEYKCCGNYFSSFTELATHESVKHPNSFRTMVESLKDLFLSILVPEVKIIEPEIEIHSQEDEKHNNFEQKPLKDVPESENPKARRRGRLPDNYQELMSQNINVKCNVCLKQILASSFEEHLRLEHPFDDSVAIKEASKFVCNCCAEIFPQISTCIKHLLNADHQLQGDTCELCGGDYENLVDLNKHRATVHSNDKSLLYCDKCPMSFKRLPNLKFHMLKHKGMKTEWCKVCGCRYLSQEALKKHLKTHENEREVICPHCGLGFKVNRSLFFFSFMV